MSHRAMVLEAPRSPLGLQVLPEPELGAHEVKVEVRACGVCRTDLHVVDGELDEPRLPLVPGHEVVGEITRVGTCVTLLSVGQRVGVPWLGETCGSCSYCVSGRENLCSRALFTGYTKNGGYAEVMVADERYCFPLDTALSDAHAAPLLCAGLIGHRAYAMVPNARRLGLYGFGAAAHILAQIATFQGREVYAFTKPGDLDGQRFARSLGAVWAGGSDEQPPAQLDGAILFAPVGALVPLALAQVAPGGTVVCAGIHMSDIPSFRYELLWGERTLRSVANLTRRDAQSFFASIREVPLVTTVTEYALGDANRALSDLRDGKLEGAAVLVP
jgi:propanol-preferring alcohol dehydrogenase